MVVTESPASIPYSTVREFQKFQAIRVSRAGLRPSRFSNSGAGAAAKDCSGFIEELVVSLGSPALYCASKARSADVILGPMPTMPSSILGPSSAIQRSLRTNSLGRRIADGLSG